MTATAEAPATDPAASVAAAREAVLTQRQILADWEARLEQAQGELDQVQERSGEEILDNPNAEDDVADRLLRARSRIETAEKAIAAQRPRVLLAESRYLTAEANHLEVTELQPSQAALEKHEARTAKLVAQLVAHEGPGRFLTQAQEVRNADRLITGPVSYKLPTSELLRRKVAALRFQVQVLRDMAAGKEPQRAADNTMYDGFATEYPGCVDGPDALVPRRAYVEAVRRAESDLRELEELAEALPDEIALWAEGLRRNDPAYHADGLERRRQRLKTIDGDIERARATLQSLAGSVAAPVPS